MRDVVHLAEKETGHNFGLNTVHKYINEAIDQWKENKAALIDNHKDIELAKINNLEATYWNAWENSLRVAKSKTSHKTKTDGRLNISRVAESEDHQGGDPQFLKGVQWCIEQRCKILGLDTPAIALQINNENNTQVNNNTTVIRRVVFKTRETTAAPQVIENPTE